MLKLVETKEFHKDLKRIRRRNLDISKLQEVILKLRREEKLDPKHRDHALSGDRKGYRECHVTPDWLFIYKVNKGELILTAFRTGTHSDLFD